MGITERREREREALRTRIVEAARDIVSEQGLDALSMRAIAERIEYSPATLYLYFRDKDELLREVVSEGFRRMDEVMRAQLAALGPEADASQKHRALGRGYARFALDNTAYFRVMFELPTSARADCSRECAAPDEHEEDSWRTLVSTIRCGVEEGKIALQDVPLGALISWGLIHGLVSLFLSGHMGDAVRTPDELMALVESAMDSVRRGWGPGETGAGGTP